MGMAPSVPRLLHDRQVYFYLHFVPRSNLSRNFHLLPPIYSYTGYLNLMDGGQRHKNTSSPKKAPRGYSLGTGICCHKFSHGVDKAICSYYNERAEVDKRTLSTQGIWS